LLVLSKTYFINFMKKLLLIIISLSNIIYAIPTTAQYKKNDNLERQLNLYKKDDTIRVKLWNEAANAFNLNNREKSLEYATYAFGLADKLKFRKGMIESLLLMGNFYKSTNSQLAIDYALKASKIAEEINDKEGIAKSFNLKGLACNTLGKFNEAREFQQNALSISENLNNQVLIAQCLINMGITYSLESNYAKATECYKKALVISEKTGNLMQIAACFRYLGIVYDYQGNHTLALEYQQKSLKICEESGDIYTATACYISIGIIYYNRGDYPKSLEQYMGALKNARETNDKRIVAICYVNIGEIYKKQKNKQAAEYFEKALKIAEETSNKPMIVNILHNFGDLFFSQQNYQKSLDYYQKSFKIAKEINNKRNICNVGLKLGAIYFKQKNIATALDYTLNSLELAREINLLPVQKDIHRQLSEIYAAKGDYKKAYIQYITYKEINDSIFNEKSIKKIAEFEYTYKFEKEKQAIELENKKNIAVREKEKKIQIIVIVSLIVMVILISILSFFLYRSKTFKHLTYLILLQQKKEIQEKNEEYIALNEEYATLNEELKFSNEQLFYTKELVEKSEEKLKVIIKNSNDILVLVNENGEQFFISEVAEDITGYTTSELTGPIEDVIYPEDIEIVKKHWERVISDKAKVDCIQYRHKHKDKGYVWLEAVAQNFLDNPSINAIVANIRDITERKRTEDSLRASEATKNRLFKQERNRIFEELVSNQKALAASTLKLIQNSERDANTLKQLAEIEKNTNEDGRKIIKKLISDYKLASFNSNWNEFEILFEKVHYFFYEKLNAKFPNLTANERKMCAFLKLNMNNKDISQITFQSDDALKKARLRLRQKLGIDRETNLVAFLQNI
jgi:PAS domain S-box-containing protein